MVPDMHGYRLHHEQQIGRRAGLDFESSENFDSRIQNLIDQAVGSSWIAGHGIMPHDLVPSTRRFPL